MVSPQIFLSIPCLTERSKSISSSEMMEKWFKNRNADKRLADRYIHNFIKINSRLFEFLDVQPLQTGFDKNINLSFRSGSYIGAIPLQSPITGKPLADFIVYPRYISEKEKINEYIELIYLLDNETSPDFIDSLDLISKNQVRPPIYYECIKFINLLYRTLHTSWVKFESIVAIKDFPKSQIYWKKYLVHEWDPSKRLDYPCRINSLNKFHDEVRQLLYICELSKAYILDHNTPIRIKNSMLEKISVIERKFASISSLNTNKMIVHNSDPVIIRQTKEQGNKILLLESQTCKAWRIDFTEIFEKYVQFLFKKICEKKGWKTKENYRIQNISSDLPIWGLRYLEPDQIITKGDYSIIIDAKYKSHFYNLKSYSEFLKSEHRFDLHQINAYCAFLKSNKKIGFLCYPSTYLKYKRVLYRNQFASTELIIYLFGIPISSSKVENIVDDLQDIFSMILKIEKIS